MAKLKYRRLLVKLSGEALMGQKQFGMDPDMVNRIAEDVGVVHKMGVQVGLVVGGGNIFRGLSQAAEGMERASASLHSRLRQGDRNALRAGPR